MMVEPRMLTKDELLRAIICVRGGVYGYGPEKALEELEAHGAALVDEAQLLGEERDALTERVAALKKIVEKLPQTADGVPITPGMEVWHEFADLAPQCKGYPSKKRVLAVTQTGVELAGVANRDDKRYDISLRALSASYSTKEAALAAKEKQE